MTLEQCAGGQLLLVAPPSGYLASTVTQTTGCGSVDAPWLIQAAPGQRISISLLDFAVPEKRISAGGSDTPQVPFSILANDILCSFSR